MARVNRVKRSLDSEADSEALTVEDPTSALFYELEMGFSMVGSLVCHPSVSYQRNVNPLVLGGAATNAMAVNSVKFHCRSRRIFLCKHDISSFEERTSPNEVSP